MKLEGDRVIEDKIIRKLRPEQALGQLKLKIGGYRRAWQRVYLGVTSDPELRWVQHVPNGWRKMVLLYEAFSPDIAKDMEIDLLEHAKRSGFIQPLENVSAGGEGLTSARRSNFLYVLVAERRS